MKKKTLIERMKEKIDNISEKLSHLLHPSPEPIPVPVRANRPTRR